MRKLLLFIAVVMMAGCATNKCGITEKFDGESSIIFAVDSSGICENPNSPGVFYKMYDTVFIRYTATYDRKGNYKTSARILNK